MLNRQVILVMIVVTGICGCLPDETSCRYFQLTERNLYNHVWSVDTFKIHVSDSASHFYLDTFFLNDGTWKFVPDKPYSCNFNGAIIFTRANGTVASFRYSISTWFPNQNDVLTLQTNETIDGYPAPYDGFHHSILGAEKITVTTEGSYGFRNRTHHPQLIRDWQFYLSRK